MYGYWGKILRVDLSKKKISVDRVDEALFEKYLGGAGVATRIVFDEVDAGVDPLSAENVIVFAVGPFQGFKIPGSGRWSVASKSPLTGIWADACGGGTWADSFKRSGFDAVAIKGRADSPVYLWIHDGETEIKDASAVWGKTTSETDKEIKEDLGDPKARVTCIGPAGEKLVKFACVINEHGVSGRCGMGAVMGSKNLKAIAARGTMQVDAAKPDELREYSKELFAKYVNPDFRKLGSPMATEPFYGWSEFPIKNWTQGTLDGVQDLYGPQVNEALSTVPVFCTNCPIGCHRTSKLEDPKKYAYEGYGPEYETIAMLGANLLITDPKAVGYMHYLCDEYGMDVIEPGALLGLCAESLEKGWVDKEKFDGVDLNWGDADAAITMIHKMGKREGFGDVLAEGINKVAEAIGKGAYDAALHVKGLSLPAHDPRAYYPWSVNFATTTRGACHQRGFAGWMGFGIVPAEWGIKQQDRFLMENAALIATKYQNWAVVFNSLVHCEYMLFGGTSLTHQVKLLNLATGWDVDIAGLETIAERIFTLQRMFDVRCGISKKDDVLPKRIFEPLKDGGAAGKTPEPFDRELREYYKLRGWDSNGKPTAEKLAELNLTES